MIDRYSASIWIKSTTKWVKTLFKVFLQHTVRFTNFSPRLYMIWRDDMIGWYHIMIWYDYMIWVYDMMIGYDGPWDRQCQTSSPAQLIGGIPAPRLTRHPFGRRSTLDNLGRIFFRRSKISKYIKITDYRFVTFWKPSAAEYIAYRNLNNKAFVAFEG